MPRKVAGYEMRLGRLSPNPPPLRRFFARASAHRDHFGGFAIAHRQSTVLSEDVMKIVFVSHTVDGGTFKVGSHHLAREFARQGWRVAHVSTPYSSVHGLRGLPDRRRAALAASGPQTDAEGVVHAVPRILVPLRAATGTRVLGGYLASIDFSDADFMVVDQPLMAAITKSPGRSTVVYRATDVYPAGVARRRQRIVLNRSAALVATSEVVMQDLRAQRSGLPELVLDNGVEFARLSGGSALRRKGAVYVGAIDNRLDWEAIRAIALALAPEPVVIAGPVRTAVPELPENVQFVGAVAYESLPDLLADASIGLLPFGDAPENEGRSPMKYFEYLAASLSIVGRGTSELAARNAPGVHLYESVAGAMQAAVDARDDVKPNAEGQALAARHDWPLKAERLAEFLRGLHV